MKINIRYVNKDDADSLGLIYSQSYQAVFRGIVPDNILYDLFSFEKRRDALRKELSEGLHVNAIMYKEENPVGFLTCGKSMDADMDDSAAEILRLYILPSCWGQRMGSRLMSWGMEELRRHGYDKICLWVIEENKRAIRLYEHMGFVHDGTLRTIDFGREIRDLRYIKHIHINGNKYLTSN